MGEEREMGPMGERETERGPQASFGVGQTWDGQGRRRRRTEESNVGQTAKSVLQGRRVGGVSAKARWAVGRLRGVDNGRGAHVTGPGLGELPINFNFHSTRLQLDSTRLG